MEVSALKVLFVQGLRGLHAADAQCIDSATDVVSGVTDSRLRDAIWAGIRMAHRQVGQLDEVFRHAGVLPSGAKNDVIAAIERATELARSAADPVARDVGVVATSRMAFHYYIAWYGTLRDYAEALGLAEAANLLDHMHHELEQTDVEFATILRRMVCALPVPAGRNAPWPDCQAVGRRDAIPEEVLSCRVA
jgi:ferritin-like metal-binding protein YciE